MDIVEKLRATPETGADHDMIFEAADEIERLRRYVDALHGKNNVRHDYNGLCPDETQPDSRDDECPACRLLTPNAVMSRP
jgi:hypothetical protein